MTYLRADGQESGAGPAGVVDVPARGGLQLSLPVPTDTSVAQKALYLTRPNGDKLTRYALVPAASSTLLVVEDREPGVDLRTQFLGPPPAGDVVALFNGFLLVAAGDAIYPSEPFAPELFDLRKRYSMPERITTLACMTNGVHCGTTERNAWLGGMTPQEWTYTETAAYGAIAGSVARVSKSHIGKGEGRDVAAIVMTARGICLLGDSGEFRNLTDPRFAYDVSADRGASLVRRHNGMNQYIGVMRGVTVAGNGFN